MRRYWAYFHYLLRHKYFIVVFGLKLKVSILRLLVHDNDKLLPWVFAVYARCLYDSSGHRVLDPDSSFNYAFNAHQKHSKHHWQYWVLVEDNGNLCTLDMPDKYIREMVADWASASHCRGRDLLEWYFTNDRNTKLSVNTAKCVKVYLTAVASSRLKDVTRKLAH